ncbi:tyrosine-type recombinase/integrase [Xenorhabdus sp. TH1]|uniref:tyrosine-type recombinase/integrase n=1 Tax=Xenorhabdus sp. TH1 TaxID=3130166 RepID=UPI0030CC2612
MIKYPTNGRFLTKITVELALLTFVRSSELRFARWQEIDLENAVWKIPATRKPLKGVCFSERSMKMKTDHIVPPEPSGCSAYQCVTQTGRELRSDVPQRSFSPQQFGYELSHWSLELFMIQLKELTQIKTSSYIKTYHEKWLVVHVYLVVLLYKEDELVVLQRN